MSSDTAILVLLLDGPLQSWGHESRFQRRTTALHPTRSGILGLLCAARGVEKGSEEEAQWLAALGEDQVRLTVLTLPRLPEGQRRPLAIRRLEDFHTVEGTRSAENKPKKDAVITHRHYLLDACFGVLLEGPRDTLEQAAAAMRDPRWGVWLGRKACIPAAPIVRGLVATAAEAMAALGLAGRQPEDLVSVTDAPSFADGTDTYMDAPVNFKTRAFRPRRLAVAVAVPASAPPDE
jgi:CRISPR system Cascade subunit CasD